MSCREREGASQQNKDSSHGKQVITTLRGQFHRPSTSLSRRHLDADFRCDSGALVIFAFNCKLHFDVLLVAESVLQTPNQIGLGHLEDCRRTHHTSDSDPSLAIHAILRLSTGGTHSLFL